MARYYDPTGQQIKAISIRQPWTEAIVLGHKTIENRTWTTNYRGRILIHAGGKPYPRNAILADAVRCAALNELGLLRAGLVRGAIIGVATLVDCRRISEINPNRWAVGPYCWILRDARRFERPIPLKGSLSLFGVDSYLVASALRVTELE